MSTDGMQDLPEEELQGIFTEIILRRLRLDEQYYCIRRATLLEVDNEIYEKQKQILALRLLIVEFFSMLLAAELKLINYVL